MKNKVYLSDEAKNIIKSKKIDEEKLVKKIRAHDPTWVFDLFGVKYDNRTEKLKNV